MYKIEYTKSVLKKIQKLDKSTKEQIYYWIDKNLVNVDNPRLHGKSLTGNFKGLWRYRIGDYRLICEIEDERLIIIAVDIGHRKEIYR